MLPGRFLSKAILIYCHLTNVLTTAAITSGGKRVSSISIKTGTVHKADSDCGAVMEICDSQGNCCRSAQNLNNPGSDRTIGKTDTYTRQDLLGSCATQGALVGDPVSAKLTSSGNNGWYVEGIWIGMNDGKTHSCPMGA